MRCGIAELKRQLVVSDSGTFITGNSVTLQTVKVGVN
jgi:hypothetical protein